MADSNNVHSGHRARLREKFKKGKELFSEHELLELLLSYSIARKDTNELAHNLINRFGSLSNVLSASPELLCQVEGVGETTANLLALVGYISTQSKNQKLKTATLNNIDEVKKIAISLFEGLDHEVFYMLYLDGKRKVLGYTLLDDGKTNSVIMNFERFSKDILIYKPKSAVVLHNHFAKFPYPSKEDDGATLKIITFLNFHNVTLFDHVIVSGNEIYSYFYDNRIQKLKQSLDSDLL
jgi:DNA repair protein RadC